MEQQVTHVCRMCYVGLREISKIRPYLSDEATKPLVVALMLSKLDCNNALLYKISKFLQNKLQSVQNNAARVIAMKRKSDQIEHIRRELHWLPIEFRIKYKIMLLTFKCLNNLAPKYLRALLEIYEPQRNLHSTDRGYLKQSKTRTATGDRAFCNAAPTLWNGLPDSIRFIKSLEVFKMAPKTHLFTTAFNL